MVCFPDGLFKVIQAMKSSYISVILFSLMTLQFLHAADGYLGVGLGQSEINQGLFGEYGNAYKVFAGARVHQNLVIEVAYIDFGNPSENLFGITKEYDAWAIGTWAKGIWPITTKFELFGKAGWAYWEIEEKTTIFGQQQPTHSSSGNDFTWGIGVAFSQWEKFSMQLEYEDFNTSLDTVTLWSISALYGF